MLYHNSRESEYRSPYGAAEVGSSVHLSITADFAKSVLLRVWTDETKETMYTMNHVSDTNLFEIDLKLPAEPTVLWYFFVVNYDDKTICYGNNRQRLGGIGEVYENEEPQSYQITVYEDYAHHPTELRAVLRVARRRTKGRLWVVFQPHTYSRVYYFFDAFAEALGAADQIILNPIYSDREKNLWNVRIEDLAEAIQSRYAKPARVCETFDEIVQTLTREAQTGDFVLVAGSQTINAVAPMLVSALNDQCNGDV